MPRVNRYHMPGLVWHITHRCHNRKFLLGWERDRHRYRYWLYEARKRYGISLLNFNLTSNHVHLLVYDDGNPEAIAASLQLVAGRTGQEFNQRKDRKGAFWQGRYHATAVQSGRHLRNCFTYIDLNMVRAGRVAHPEEWVNCGFNEVQHPRKRYRILDLNRAMTLLGLETLQELANWQREAVVGALGEPLQRQPLWTETLAVGEPNFLESVARRLHQDARFRSIQDVDGFHYLEEAKSRYRQK